jgi:indolepyruvate ferredoxin oxidoreductase beta subunit
MTVYGNSQTVVISNTRPIYPVDVTSGNEKYPEEEEIRDALKGLSRKVYYVPATEKALEMGSPILGNMIMMGALLELDLLPLSPDEFRKTLGRNFKEARLETNLRALEEGKRTVRP